MSPAGKALVVGATGMIGSRVCERLVEDGWQTIGVCRTPPHPTPDRTYLPVDLLDRADCAARLAPLHDVSHVFYAARAAHGEGGTESVSENLAMLQNVVEALQTSGALRHVHIIQGGKYYGQHLGPYKSPAKEDDPRHMPPNFYYDQQDWLEANAGNWTWTASRPCLVYDFVPGRARNLISVIAVYAAISRALGLPLSFPGTPENYHALSECAAVPHVAKAIVWMASEARCANRAFNITNGDSFRWENLWPRLADHFAMPTGPLRPMSLAATMADKAPIWNAIVAQHGLRPTPYEDLALWPYGDFVFAPRYDIISDMNKARRFGFHDCLDSEAMFFDMFARYREARLIP
jgi:nucleoside-diphosphate-sugar epimerase